MPAEELTNPAPSQPGMGMLAAGLVSLDTGGGTIANGPGMVVVAALLGAFLGLMFGFATLHAIRFVSMSCGRYVTATSWTVISMVCGALIMALITLFGGEE